MEKCWPVAEDYLTTKVATDDHANWDGQTALHRAALNGNLKIISKILENFPEEISRPDIDMKSPLGYAFGGKQDEAIKYLIQKNSKNPVLQLLLSTSKTAIDRGLGRD